MRDSSSDDLTDDLVEIAQRLADHVRHGELVVFMGAGICAGAGLPGWRTLLTELWQRFGGSGPEEEFLELPLLDATDLVAPIKRLLDHFGWVPPDRRASLLLGSTGHAEPRTAGDGYPSRGFAK